MATAERTRDEDTIRDWVEARNGHPAQVRGTEGLLRIDFEDGDRDEDLEQISWEDFFAVFEDRGLTFLYDPEGESRFNKMIRDEESAKGATRTARRSESDEEAEEDDEDADEDDDDFEDEDDEDFEDEDDDEEDDDDEDDDEDDEDDEEESGSSKQEAKTGGRKGSSSKSSSKKSRSRR